MQIGARLELGKLIRIFQQLDDARPEHVGGGRIACNQQQADKQHDILCGKAVALLLSLRKAGDQVVARLGPANIDFARQIIGKHGRRFLI